jgi:GNAT superfamily N-acetyltransferase
MISDQARYSIRRATPADAAKILHCLHEAFEPYRKFYSPEAFNDTVLTRETVYQRLAAMALFVAVTDDDKVVGTIGCSRINAEEGHLRGMAVLAQWQGSAVASDLLQRAESELRSHGCNRVTLDTTEPLERAVWFYEKNGYKRSGKVGDLFGMQLFEYIKLL